MQNARGICRELEGGHGGGSPEEKGARSVGEAGVKGWDGTEIEEITQYVAMERTQRGRRQRK